MKTKNVKRILALVLAFTMIMGLSLTTFAATPSGGYITVPVTIEVVDYEGTIENPVLFNSTVSLPVNGSDPISAMDFILATNLDIELDESENYITSIEGIENYDAVYTDHYYEGYSWMIDLKAGSSVAHQGSGTVPSWFDVPVVNNWFSSSLAATNVNMNGSQMFIYDYETNPVSAYTTSIEGIRLQFVMTTAAW